MSVIQQVYLAEAGYSIYIKGIKPDKDNECSGESTTLIMWRLGFESPVSAFIPL